MFSITVTYTDLLELKVTSAPGCLKVARVTNIARHSFSHSGFTREDMEQTDRQTYRAYRYIVAALRGISK